ncbi:MAG: DNA internalization-related competence protein ComEC/Rec2 [Gammaproteobacteria bacterium]
MIVAALCFLAGVAVVQLMPSLTETNTAMFLATAIGLMCWRRYWRSVFFLAGVLWTILFASVRLHGRLPEPLEGLDLRVSGRIVSVPDVQEKSIRFDFAVTEADFQIPSKLRLTWYHPDRPIKAGQTWTFTVKLKRPHGTFNPGGFEYERWLFMEGIGATGYIRGSSVPELLKEPPRTDVSGLRQRLLDRLSGQLSNPASLALIRALSLGDGSLITQAQWEVFRSTGTTHLVVISGSHIGLIAGLVYFLALKGWAWTGLFRWPPPRVAACISLAAAIFYAFLAGFAIPTQRAVIMLAVVMIALIRQRQTDPFNTLAAALFAVLLADPLAVLSAGFWLSFLAVVLIFIAIAGRLQRPGVIVGALKLHAVTSLGLAPLLLFYFQQVSLIAPLANLLAVPIISLIVLPFSLLGLAVLPLSSIAAQLFLLPADYALQGLSWLLSKMSAIPLATLHHPAPPPWGLIFATPGILLLLSPRGTSSRWLGAVMLLPLVYSDVDRPRPGELRMTLLDVGQGLAATVQTANHWLVYDTGTQFSKDSDMGRSVVLPFLFTKGVDQIDTMIVSHGDSDHVGGAASVLQSLKVSRVITSAPDKLAGYEPSACHAGQSWQWDEVTFTMLSPADLSTQSENNNSCVLKIQSAHGAILLTGDIEAPAENWLVEQYPKNLHADILVAPHHGSKTSSTERFLDAVRPEFILIPAGYRNQFGHPHPSVLERYEGIGAKWLTSADSGAILVNLSNQLISVEAYRQKDKKYWHAEK